MIIRGGPKPRTTWEPPSTTWLESGMMPPSSTSAFLRTLTSEYFLSRYPDAAGEVPYTLYDGTEAREYLQTGKGRLQWVAKQLPSSSGTGGDALTWRCSAIPRTRSRRRGRGSGSWPRRSKRADGSGRAKRETGDDPTRVGGPAAVSRASNQAPWTRLLRRPCRRRAAPPGLDRERWPALLVLDVRESAPVPEGAHAPGMPGVPGRGTPPGEA